ncbi:ABC1 kinase family protein [Pseudoxanthomonas mexicana]|uniref:ABC1 kinase family protein n=1 Tax=Pseudoxanthomonas mexicana TaxID=128785 RepID=UPI00398A90AA
MTTEQRMPADAGGQAAPASPADTHEEGRLARRARILRFLFRYRHLAAFSGMSLPEPPPDSEAAQAQGEEPARFARDLEALGPGFIKLGQMLSTRPDFVPPAYAEALECMQEDVTPIPFAQIRQVIEDQLGLRLGAVFAEFDETPLGAASLAQVHAATLRSGLRVAVKVQRPGLLNQLLADLDILAGFASTADKVTDLGRRVHFADWVHEFRKTLLAELDYVAEAENLERFGQHLAPYPQLVVPRPVWDLVRPRLLVMERVTGVRVDQVTDVRRLETDMHAMVTALVRGYLDQIFVHGEIHADPHPGNLRVLPDDRLAIFDLGMIAHIPPRQRDRLLKLLFAAVDGRGEEVAEESIRLGTRLDDYDEERYLREVGQLVAHYAAHADSASEGRVLMQLVQLATACGLRTPPEMSLLGRTLLNLEAVCRHLAPDLLVRDMVEEHLQRVMQLRLRKSLSPSNLASEIMELQVLLRESPRKISDVLSLLAENRFQLRVTGLEESRLLENMQKIANRISAGLVAAALIVASTLMMRVETEARLLGYPALALLMFLIGAFLGIGIIVSALLTDRRAKRREERGPR